MEDEVSTERALGRIEGKVDMILARLDTTFADHNRRITAVERKTWYGAGAVGVLALFAGKLAIFPH